MFDTLNDKFEKIVRGIRGKAVISESDLDSTLREIRIALLEADVALVVVKDFISSVKENILGKEVLKSIKPDQMIIKLVQDELVNILGSENQPLNIVTSQMTKILFCGLQGSGKTTSVAKLANHLVKSSKKKVLLSSADIYRPAAQEQLNILGERNSIQTLPIVKDQLPLDIAKRALNAASLSGTDVIIFDTAGRTQIDLSMMNEIKEIKSLANPVETILVADSLTGQVAVNVAQEFKKTVDLTGIILTRVDGDGRGGAALSMKFSTNTPIKFMGIGEKIEQLDVFHPDRIANRILGMGDVVSLVEKATQDLDEEKIKKTEESLKSGSFSMEDYLSQLRQMKKMGGMEGVLSMLPGVSKIKKQMEYANKIGSPAAILYGDDEIKSGKVTLKNLKSGKETSITIESLSDEIKKIL